MNYKKFLNSVHENKVHCISVDQGSVAFNVSTPHYLTSTSGSVVKKIYLHSLENIKNSVNSFLKSHPLTKDDRWWVSLPTKHVAGFSILTRSYFSDIKAPFEEPFTLSLEKIEKEEITLLSLVPTQIFDIASKGLKAPKKLKYVFVGGAPLNQRIYNEAKILGWPLVSCFGSTETFAQFASSTNNKDYELYDGWSFQKNLKEELEVKGPGLFSYFKNDGEFIERPGDWVNLRDKIIVNENSFSFVSRSDGLYKKKGIYNDFNKEKAFFETLVFDKNIDISKHFLLLLEEERGGAALYLMSTDIAEAEVICRQMPEIRGTYLFKSLNHFKSDLGKPLRSKIEDALSKPLLLS